MYINIMFEPKNDVDFKLLQKIRDLDTGINNLIFNSKNISKKNRKMKIKQDLCATYKEMGRLERYYLPSIWRNHVVVKTDDITLVTQSSLSRFKLVDLHVKQWSGPISIAIYLRANELWNVKKMFIEHNSVLKRKNIDIHLVLMEGVGKIYP